MSRETSRVVGLVATVLLFATGVAHADGAGDPKSVTSQDGKYLDTDGNPTFHIAQDGAVDWYTYVGYLRYGANCLQCHGPDGLGSSYAPSLVDSLKSLSYADFLSIVAGGKKDINAAQQLVMPSFGTNPNVMCYIDAIYVYLRARSDGALGRERPDKHEPRPNAFTKAEDSCMG
jgi:methanol metabolism-related c-type cytochrome